MTDRELLEMAAKAAGFEMAYTGENEKVLWLVKPGSLPDPDGEKPIFPWNPLAHDGDALRLAVKLHFQITVGTETIHVEGLKANGILPYSFEKVKVSASESTRRAIVRAAAEIGRSMP